MSLILFIKLQVNLVKKRSEKGSEYEKIPYKDALEYQAIVSLNVISKYPYQAIYMLALVAMVAMVLAYLFNKQLGEDDANPNKRQIMVLTICSVYLFVVMYYAIQIRFRNNVKPLKDKIDEFNSFVRSLMPPNFEFLKALSTPPQYRAINTEILKALASVEPNVKDIVRSICLINLYNYYIGQYVEGDPQLNQVLSCFDPINRLLSTQGSCFTDYLKRNDTFIENNVSSIIRNVEDFMEEDNGVRAFINANRVDILTKVDKMMNEMNERANCLDSAVAFSYFVRMSWMVLILLWFPAMIVAWIARSITVCKTNVKP